jgi:hypothetical protein
MRSIYRAAALVGLAAAPALAAEAYVICTNRADAQDVERMQGELATQEAAYVGLAPEGACANGILKLLLTEPADAVEEQATQVKLDTVCHTPAGQPDYDPLLPQRASEQYRATVQTARAGLQRTEQDVLTRDDMVNMPLVVGILSSVLVAFGYAISTEPERKFDPQPIIHITTTEAP